MFFFTPELTSSSGVILLRCYKMTQTFFTPSKFAVKIYISSLDSFMFCFIEKLGSGHVVDIVYGFVFGHEAWGSVNRVDG